ncbi:MAG: TetR/AcrR family transcriptional regulator [Pseudomonadota bacterium]
MSGSRTGTREKIIDAADGLFYAGSIREVSVDRIAAAAGVTKKTLYYHFRSKDDLIAAYLEARQGPTIERYRSWAGDKSLPLPDRVQNMFVALSKAAQSPDWKGCGFIRAAVELADSPGHPALDVARRYKAAFVDWLRAEFESAGYPDASNRANGVMILLDGAISRILVDRNPAHAVAAGDIARRLLTND